jgi:hypothetical protein
MFIPGVMIAIYTVVETGKLWRYELCRRSKWVSHGRSPTLYMAFSLIIDWRKVNVKYTLTWTLGKKITVSLLTMGADVALSVEWLGYGVDKDSSAEERMFSLLPSVHSGCGAHPASYKVRSESFVPGIRWRGAFRWPVTPIWRRG